MKPKPKVSWNVPPDDRAAPKKRQIQRQALNDFPRYMPEMPMSPTAVATWDEISLGSAFLTSDMMVFASYRGFPLPVLTYPRDDASLRGDRIVYTNTFGVFVGMTNVKMVSKDGTEVIDRAWRTVLIGHNKYLLANPNLIKAV
jgi:hypothetical protein